MVVGRRTFAFLPLELHVVPHHHAVESEGPCDASAEWAPDPKVDYWGCAFPKDRT